MRWSDIPFSPSEKTLRQFAGLCLLFFGGFAAWQWLKHGNATLALIFGALALGLGVLGLARPSALRPIFVGWMVVAFPIGWAVSIVLLGLVYFGLFLPIGLVFRLVGRDALLLRPRRGLETYWVAKSSPTDVRRYFQQF